MKKNNFEQKLLISLILPIAFLGQNIINNIAYASDIVPVPTLTQLHDSGAAIPDTDPPVVYPESAYSISNGTSSDYNFSISSYDNKGNVTVKYYKIDLKMDTIAPGSLIWNEVATLGEDTIEITLPNNDKKYLHYTYKAPDGYNVNTLNGLKITKQAGNNLDIYYIRTPSYTNTSTLNNLKGSFINNYGFGYNVGLRNSGKIKNLHANFMFNWNMSNECKGAALYNSSIIRNIVGDFIGNYIEANGYSPKTGGGGALYNDKGTIDNILGDFIGNHSITNGGAIYNNNGYIETITGNFISNYNNNYGLQGDIGYAYGGAIYNLSGNIEKITGNFVSNYSESNGSGSTSYSYGGAIYNTGKLGLYNSLFYNNYAVSHKGPAQGGAIYTTTDLNIIADNGYSIFKDNYTDSNGTADNNAIYVAGTDTTLTLNAINNGEIFMYDNIRGDNGYNLNINGDDTGFLHLYNNIYEAIVNTNNITIDMVNNDIYNYIFKELKSDQSTKYKIDIDLAETGRADTISATNPYSGLVYDSIVTLTDVNLMNIDAATNDNYKIQVLKTNNDYLQLVLSDELANKEFVLSTTESKNISDEILPVVNWNQKFETYTENKNIVGKITLDTTDTTNDSISFNKTGSNITKTDRVSLGDTLALVNQLETTENKSFNFDTANDKYNVSQDLGQTTAGTLSINGVSDEDKRSEVNLNGYNGFELVNNSTLNFNNLNLTGNDTIITVNNSASTINLQNSSINGDISAENNYSLNINGSESDKTILNGTVGNSTTTLNGSTLEFNADTFKDSSLTTKGGAINLVTGKVDNYLISSLDSDASTKYGFDVDASGENITADTLSVGSGSEGIVTVSEVNFINGRNPDKEFVVQLLDAQNDNIQLAVDNKLIGENKKIGTTSKITTDTVVPNVKWNDTFNKHTQNGTNYGNINLSSTSTTNDSISLDITNTEWDDNIITTSMGDTLALVNQLETEEDRNFNFDSGEDIYEITADLGTSAKGSFNINGKISETGRSTINGNSHNMFALNNPTTLNLNNVKVTNANSVVTGTSKEAVINLNNVEIKDNKSGITTAGSVNITGNSRFENNGNGIQVTSEESMITLNGLDGDGEITINDRLSGVKGARLNLKAGVVNLGKTVSGLDVSMESSTTNLASDNLLNGLNMTVDKASNLNMVNNTVGAMHLNSLTLKDNMNLGVDVDLANKSMDRISADSYDLGNNKVNVNQMNLLSDAKETYTDIQFADEKLKNNVTTTVSEVAYSPIYKYGVKYDNESGKFGFTRSGGGVAPSFTDLNPSVMVSPVAAQLGGYMGMLDTYNNAFNNMDIRMLQTSSFRAAQKNANRYAISEGNTNYVTTENNSGGFWARPYTAYDSVNLHHGPKVHNMSYGTFIGGDSGIWDYGNGVEAVFSAYASYQGSHQSFGGNSIYQNGANLGFTGTLYKGNFFTGLTAATGVSLADASTMYGSEDFPMLSAGVASKTGYNIEFKEGKFIIQPSLLLSYSFVNTFNYTNAAGVKIDAQPLHAIQISPNIRFSFNTKRGWQPYLTAGMNWNIMNNENNFLANETSLPNFSIKPYFQYGVGIQKLVNDNFTGFAQVLLRNGGRNGIAATLGMRYLLDYNSNYRPSQKHNIKENNQL